ncbi:K(+)/H(+) antiporter [Dinochytrium kinnereticum]|nr:K(+)/H(+) antiporter [Dinochytrium kinnereticum]
MGTTASGTSASSVSDIHSGFIATPHAFDSDGLARLLIQIFIILCVCRAISYPFKFLRQPSVIAEVIGGILMGPTALSRWPWFKKNIFPGDSLPVLSVLANLGLLMFLLLMGLKWFLQELDLSVVAKRARVSLTISLTGIACTFALSVGVSRFFYDMFPDISNGVAYPKLMLFIGVAMSVTAFPVLARILTERKLLRTPVGISVISAAAVDDAAGWMALALVIALIQATSPLTGLYIFLTVMAFAGFMFIVVRPALARLHRYLLALRNQNANRDEVTLSQPMVLVAFLLTFAAAFFTSAVGIHAIFGAFITGLILPRDDGFAVKLTEKLEELVTIVLLPLYFTFSGLRTNIGAINTGISFAGFLLVLFAACSGKIGGCSAAARFCGLNMRESLAVGVLMNTKGLVEIIILNIGLDAGLINDQVFAVMVLLAIVTTCMTTPLISLIYPESYYSSTTREVAAGERTMSSFERFQADEPKKLMLCLPTTSSVATMMGLLHKVSSGRSRLDVSQFLQESKPQAHGTPNASNASIAVTAAAALAKAAAAAAAAMPNIHVVRLRQMTDRMSTLIRAASEADGASWSKDPSLTALKTFGLLRGVDVTPHVLLSHVRDYAKEVAKLAYETDCDTIVVPWRMVKSSVAKPYIIVTDDPKTQLTDRGPASSQTRPGDLLASLFGVSTAGSAASLSLQQQQQTAQPGRASSVISAKSDGACKEGDLAVPVFTAPMPVTSTVQSYELEGWIGELASQLLRKARVKVAVLVDRNADGMLDDEEVTGNEKIRTDVPDSAVIDADGDTQKSGELPKSVSSTHVAAPAVPPAKSGSIVVPFFGGPDDRAALQLAMRLASSNNSDVSVLHIRALHPIPPADISDKPTSAAPDVVEVRGSLGGNAAPGLLRPKRNLRLFGGASEPVPVGVVENDEEEDEMVPEGCFVDPVDAEDAKLLGFVVGVALCDADVRNVYGGEGEEVVARIHATSVTSAVPRPVVTITEVMSLHPLSTCLEMLDSNTTFLQPFSATNLSPSSSPPSLVIVGHYGPTWTGLVMGAGVPAENCERTMWTMQHAGHQDTVASLASIRGGTGGMDVGVVVGGGGVGGVEEKALGPTGAAIIKGGVGRWNLMVVRKIRIDGKLKEV